MQANAVEERKSFPRASTAASRLSEGGLFREPWVVARTTATLIDDERR